MELNLKPEKECKFDAVSLGEVMLRLDPGEGRIRTARSFRAWEGGGEYNVVRGLQRTYTNTETAIPTAPQILQYDFSVPTDLNPGSVL